MQKIKRVFVSTLVSTLFLSSLFLTGCKEDIDTHYNLTTTGTIYFDGEQTVSLTPSKYKDYLLCLIETIK